MDWCILLIKLTLLKSIDVKTNFSLCLDLVLQLKYILNEKKCLNNVQFSQTKSLS